MEQVSIKRMYRSQENRMVAGVLGGIAEYLNLDPTVLRVLYVLITALTGFFPFIVAYIVLVFVIPEDPSAVKKNPNMPPQMPHLPVGGKKKEQESTQPSWTESRPEQKITPPIPPAIPRMVQEPSTEEIKPQTPAKSENQVLSEMLGGFNEGHIDKTPAESPVDAGSEVMPEAKPEVKPEPADTVTGSSILNTGGAESIDKPAPLFDDRDDSVNGSLDILKEKMGSKEIDPEFSDLGSTEKGSDPFESYVATEPKTQGIDSIETGFDSDKSEEKTPQDTESLAAREFEDLKKSVELEAESTASPDTASADTASGSFDYSSILKEPVSAVKKPVSSEENTGS